MKVEWSEVSNDNKSQSPMMRATILRSTLRAARSMAFRPAPISARFIQTSIPRRAEEAKSSSFSSDPSVDPQIQELRAKIESHEGCRQAIVRLAELMTKNGKLFGSVLQSIVKVECIVAPAK